MKRRKTLVIVLRLCIVFCIVQAVLKFYDAMPSYGVKNKALKATLHTLLSDDVPKISVADAAAKKEKVIFLDAREKEEYAISHLPNARFIGYENFTLDSLPHIQKDKEVIVYCAVGKRSDVIAKKLMEAGYTNVHNLFGGIFEWVNQGEKVYKNNSPTNEVHAYNKFWGQWLTGAKKIY